MVSIPLGIISKAHQFAEHKGMQLNKNQVEALLKFITPDIIKWAERPPVQFKKGYKGGIKRVDS